MNSRPITLSEKAARLAAQKPWLTWPQVMAELSRRRRQKPVRGVLHVTNTDRAQFSNIESAPKTYAWMNRADLS